MKQLEPVFHHHGEKRIIKEIIPVIRMQWKEKLNLLLVEWLESNNNSLEEGNLKLVMPLDIVQEDIIRKRITVNILISQ